MTAVGIDGRSLRRERTRGVGGRMHHPYGDAPVVRADEKPGRAGRLINVAPSRICYSVARLSTIPIASAGTPAAAPALRAIRVAAATITTRVTNSMRDMITSLLRA